MHRAYTFFVFFLLSVACGSAWKVSWGSKPSSIERRQLRGYQVLPNNQAQVEALTVLLRDVHLGYLVMSGPIGIQHGTLIFVPANMDGIFRQTMKDTGITPKLKYDWATMKMHRTQENGDGTQNDCKYMGGICSTNEECCSKNCLDGLCTAGENTTKLGCKGPGARCFSNQQCCSKQCSVNLCL